MKTAAVHGLDVIQVIFYVSLGHSPGQAESYSKVELLTL